MSLTNQVDLQFQSTFPSCPIVLSRKPEQERKNTRGTYFNSKNKELEKRYAMLKKHQTTR